MRVGGSSREVLLMGMALVAIGIATAAVFFGSRTPRVNERTAMLEIVEAAIQSDRNGYGQLEGLEFLVPLQIFDYSGDFTFGQLVAKLRSNFDKPPGEISRTLKLREFVKWLAESFIADGSPFQRVAINASPAPGSLTILLVDPAQLPKGSSIDISTCAYIGRDDVILCDTSRIMLAIERIDHYVESQSLVLAAFEGAFNAGFRVNFLGNLDDLKSLVRQNFLTWLIGHEVGHSIRHRGWALSSGKPLHFDLTYDTREQEADLFVTGRLDHNPALNASFAPLLLEFVDQERARILKEKSRYQLTPEERGKRSDAAKSEITLQFNQDTSLFLRALNMLVTLARSDPGALERAELRPVGGHFGFVHSVKSADYVAQLRRTISTPLPSFNRDRVTWIGLATILPIIIFLLWFVSLRADWRH